MGDGARVPGGAQEQAEARSVACWVSFVDGEEQSIPVQAVRDYITNSGGRLLGSDILEVTPIGGGIVRLDVHLEAITEEATFSFEEGATIPIARGIGTDSIRADVAYFVLFEGGEIVDEPLEIGLWTCDADALQSGRPNEWEMERVILTGPDGEQAATDSPTLVETLEDGTEAVRTLGDFGLDPERLVTFYDTDAEAALTLGDLLGGIVVLRASVGVAMQLRERREGRERGAVAIPLAQYARAEVFQNHDLSAKAIDGLFAIAMGEPSFELAPRNGRSHERYLLTASEDAATELFQVRGANTEQVRAILGTVQSLRKDTRAAAFVHEGRVWFTVNKIAEELLRTSAGTIRGKDNETARALVDATLAATSGAQIKCVSPDGTATTVVYLLNAVRLEKVTYNGEVYRDVWGFEVSADTLAEYAEGKGHAYRYALPNRAKPFTLDTVWINSYLSDALHEARGKLYSVSDKGTITRRRTKTFVVTRSWEKIFELASPTRPLTSRQKNKLVRGFEDELTDLVREEAHDERHEGMPLYVRAWSERDGGRGRGKGAYRNLCLEVSTTFRAVRDGRAGHGSVNLQDGIAKAAPDNAPK